MPTLTTKDGELEVSTARIVRMADRMHKLGGKGRRENYIEKARARVEAARKRLEHAEGDLKFAVDAMEDAGVGATARGFADEGGAMEHFEVVAELFRTGPGGR